MGDAICRRCGGGVDIASWAHQDDGRYSCRMSGIRTDGVGEKIEAVHLWSHPHTASNALRNEAAGQWDKQTTELVYLGGAISESAYLDIEIKRHIGAAWASVRKYSFQLYDRRNARLSLKIRLFKAEVMEAMLYGCATWIMHSQDFSSLRTAHHKLLLRNIGFRGKDRTGY